MPNWMRPPRSNWPTRWITARLPTARRPAEVQVLVVPRLGTISPWSTKATDIAQHCGLSGVQRIERGVVYYLRDR